jgi:aminopeptidase N
LLNERENPVLKYCTRAQAIELGNGDSLLFFNMALPSPSSRSFELPGDQLHYAPERPADVQHVKLVISLDFEQETITGTAYTTFSALYEEVRTITFDAVELNIEAVTLESGPSLDYATTNNKLIVTLDRLYRHGEQFTLAIKYNAKPRIGLQFIKPAPEDPTRPVHAWTFGQPRYHSHWFPCHDSPNDRATTEIIATVPAQFLTISNGNLLSVTDNGATKTHHWRHDVPHAAYLVSLVVGDFAVIEDSYNGKPVTYYIRRDREQDARLYMGKTPQMMQFFSEYTGVEYPYDRYAQTVVEVYTGAMEHTTCTTHSFALVVDKKASLDFSHDYVPVVAHELAHQWFGDLLTCRDWSHGWLNEGFATYFERMWVEHDEGVDEFKYSMLQEKNGYLAEDSTYRRPIVYYAYNDQGFELFDRHLYNKGGWVLHMLRHQLTNEGFRRGIRTYLERFRTKEVVTSDLQRTLEEVTGHSLERFFQQWVFSGGHPNLEVSYEWDSERKLVRLRIKQTQKVDALTPCFRTPLNIACTVPTSDEGSKDENPFETRVVRLRVMLGEEERVEQTFYIPVEREPLMVRIDPEGWLLKTLKFERSTKMLRYQLAHDPDVLGRVEAAEALGEKTEEKSRQALIYALNNATFWAVRATAAKALAKHGTPQAQAVLIDALGNLDPKQFSRVREAIASALGTFQAPQSLELAQKSAQALRIILEQGDVSYMVEGSCAEALGKTRVEGNVDFLLRFLNRPSWMSYVQRAIFRGLGQSGEERVVDILTNYLSNSYNALYVRLGAAVGLLQVGSNQHLYSEAARQRAVNALCEAVQHDSWEPTRAAVARTLATFGDKRAIAALEAAANVELDDGVKRAMRVAAHTLRTSDKGDEQYKQLRKDLDEMREENRSLREQLAAIEARLK